MYLMAALQQLKDDVRRKIAIEVGCDDCNCILSIVDEIKTFSTVNQAVLQLNAPGYSIIKSLLMASNHVIDYDTLRDQVREDFNSIRDRIDAGDLYSVKSNNIDLYRKVLFHARMTEHAIDESEATILEVLRSELSLSLSEHFLIQYEDFFKPFWLDVDRSIDNQIGLLTQNGLLYCSGQSLILPRDLVDLFKESIGFSLSDEDKAILFGRLTGAELSEFQSKRNVRARGSKDDKVGALVLSGVSVVDVLGSLSIERLRGICESLSEPIYGRKEQIIERISESIESGRYLNENDKLPPPTEERELSEDQFKSGFGNLKIYQMRDILRSIPHAKRKTGDKPTLLNSLWDLHLAEKTLLSKLKIAELKSLLSECGLSERGSKVEKIDRFIDYARSNKSKSTALVPIEYYQVKLIEENDESSKIPIENAG